MTYIREAERHVPVKGTYDLIVCGGGPAGVTAAITAGRLGLRTLLIEGQGCLGGTWTAGLLCIVLDTAGKAGFMEELQDRLKAMGGWMHSHNPHRRYRFVYDPEIMKVLLDELCMEAGVDVRLHSRVVSVVREGDAIKGVITESFGGREAFLGRLFVDGTGNGDLAACAGCGFDHGHPQTGQVQPASMAAIIAGVPDDVPFMPYSADKDALRVLLQEYGVDPTYQKPFLFKLPIADMWCLMMNHEYNVKCDSTEDVSLATMRSRGEVFRAVQALRKAPGWENVHLLTTSSHLGLREGRRVHGRYTVTADDLANGRKFPDGVCTVRFPVDIHTLELQAGVAATDEGIAVKPYHIPYRSLLARDVRNLGLTGRCVSGDFFAHASYRVTANSVAMGEAIAIGASLAQGDAFAEDAGAAVGQEMAKRGYEV